MCLEHRFMKFAIITQKYIRTCSFILVKILLHSTPFYLPGHSGVVPLRSICCESFFPAFSMAFLLTYRQKINHRGKKLLHPCIGASQRQEIRTGEGNKGSWTFGQRSNYIFIRNRLRVISLPVTCKFLESDPWGCICKIKQNDKGEREKKKKERKASGIVKGTHPVYSCTFQNEDCACLPQHALLGSKCSFSTTALQAFHFCNLHVKAGNQSPGEHVAGPRHVELQHREWKVRVSSPTWQWWGLGGFSQNAPGLHCIQRNRSRGPLETIVGLSENTAPNSPGLFSFMFFLPFTPSPLSFCLSFPLFLSFCDLKEVISLYFASEPWKQKAKNWWLQGFEWWPDSLTWIETHVLGTWPLGIPFLNAI